MTKNNCISSASYGSCAPVTVRELPPGLVESQFQDESQTQRSLADVDTVSGCARSFTEVHALCPDYLNSGPSSGHQTPAKKNGEPVPDVEGGILFEECNDVREPRGWHGKLREFEASPLAKRRTAGPATEAGHCRSPHGWFLDDDTIVCAC